MDDRLAAVPSPPTLVGAARWLPSAVRRWAASYGGGKDGDGEGGTGGLVDLSTLAGTVAHSGWLRRRPRRRGSVCGVRLGGDTSPPVTPLRRRLLPPTGIVAERSPPLTAELAAHSAATAADAWSPLLAGSPGTHRPQHETTACLGRGPSTYHLY